MDLPNISPSRTIEEMATVPGKHFLANLFSRRDLLLQMVRRDFERRFIGSAAGWLWGIFHPLATLACWTFVFNYSLGVKVPPYQGTENYTLFLLCGFMPWMLFQETVQRSATALVENGNLITKTLFPSELIPVSIFLSSLVNHLLTLALALTAIAWAGVDLSFKPVALIGYILLIGLFSIGVSWFVSSLHVFLRDTAQVTIIVLTIWMWLTPIFMTADQVKGPLRGLLLKNPLSYAATGYRDLLRRLSPPSGVEFVWLAASAVLVFVIGGLVFRQLKPGFADVL
jgi:lipopolysaccharide transport system permease protein